MTSILILGGYGFTGKALAPHLLRQTDARIILAGRHEEKAHELANALNTSFPGARVSGRRIDAASAAAMSDALHDVDLLLVAAPTTQHAATVINAALQAGADYLDVQLGATKLALLQSRAPEIERAGYCFITEAGFHPGLPAVMVRYAAEQLECIEEAHVGAYFNLGPSLPYSESVDELMELFRSYQGQVFENGAWRDLPIYETRRFDFGGEIGARQSYPVFFEEMRALPEMLPALEQTGFYMAGMHWVVDWIITPLVFAGLQIAPQRAARPLGKLMWWGMQTFPRAPYLVMLKVVATGYKNGARTKVEACISHHDGYEMTAIPVVACLQQYLDGSARRPGLWMMGHLVEPVRLFEDMRRMGTCKTVHVTQ